MQIVGKFVAELKIWPISNAEVRKSCTSFSCPWVQMRFHGRVKNSSFGYLPFSLAGKLLCSETSQLFTRGRWRILRVRKKPGNPVCPCKLSAQKLFIFFETSVPPMARAMAVSGHFSLRHRALVTQFLETLN